MIRFEVQQFARGWFVNGNVYGHTRREAWDKALCLLTYHRGVQWQGPIQLRLHPRQP